MEFMLSCDDKQGVMYVFAVENSSKAFLSCSVLDLNMPVKSVKICSLLDASRDSYRVEIAIEYEF